MFSFPGRKFCYVMMRFWHLSITDVPEDPESIQIFRITDNGDDPPKKIVTAVYE